MLMKKRLSLSEEPFFTMHINTTANSKINTFKFIKIL